MLFRSSVGLQNPGVEYFLKHELPFLKQFDTNVIVNVCGSAPEEYVGVVKALADADVDMLELNISCPNVSEGGIAFGTDCGMVEKIVSEIKKHAKQPLIVKLSPNVTNIAAIAKSAEKAGADALSLINTLLGMKIDIEKRKPVLSRKIGGLSGPAVKPVAVRMVWEVANAVKIPVIGMGGIMNAEDAVEFIMAGATAVAVGTANFTNPYVTAEIVSGIEKFMRDKGIRDLSEIRGII